MPGHAIVFGLLLTALGVTAYVSPQTVGGLEQNKHQITALSPAFIGLPILLAGIAALAAPGAKHAMHAAAVLGLLGTIGGLVPAFRKNFDTTQASVLVGISMTVLSGLFLALCVKSFIDARKAREKEATAPTETNTTPA